MAVIEGLSRALPAGRQRRVTVIGGVAMILGYGAHRTTDDMDVIMAPDVAPEVYEAALQVSEDFDLEADWLNQKAVEANLIRHPHAEGIVHRRLRCDLGVQGRHNPYLVSTRVGCDNICYSRSGCGARS